MLPVAAVVVGHGIVLLSLFASLQPSMDCFASGPGLDRPHHDGMIVIWTPGKGIEIGDGIVRLSLFCVSTIAVLVDPTGTSLCLTR